MLGHERRKNAPTFDVGQSVCYTARFVAGPGGCDYEVASMRGTVENTWELSDGELMVLVRWRDGVSSPVFWRNLAPSIHGVMATDPVSGYCQDCGRVCCSGSGLCGPCTLERTDRPNGG